MTAYYKRRWDETRGDAHDDWGPSWWFFEVDAHGYPVRQIEMYDNGPTKRYSKTTPEDEDGRLSTVRLEEVESWAPWQISAAEFQEAWNA